MSGRKPEKIITFVASAGLNAESSMQNPTSRSKSCESHVANAQLIAMAYGERL